MSEQTIEERLNELKQKQDYVGDPFGAADLKTLVEGIEYAMSHGGDVSVAITPVENGYKITVTDSEGQKQEATVQNGGDAYAVYVSTVPEGQTPMSKTEWLASLKGATGDNGHNPCLGRFTALPTLSPNPFEDAQTGDYFYYDTTDQQTSDPVTYIYHFDGEDWDGGTVIDAEHPTLASGQAVTSVHIKDLNGDDDPNAQGVLSSDAGKNLRSNIFGGIVTSTDSEGLDEGKYWKTNINVGDTFNPSGALTTVSDSLQSQYKYKHIVLNVGESCTAIHKAGNSSNSFRRYVVTDSENEVLYVGGTESTIQTDTFTATSETGILNVYLNFYDTESTFEGQSLTKTTHTIVGGALNEVKESLSYYDCSSAADVDKVVTSQNFVLSTKVRFLLKMQCANTKSNPTLKVGSSDAKSMYLNGVIVSDENTWAAGDVLDVYYDGTQYQCKSFSGSMSVEELKMEIEGIPEEEEESITLENGYFKTGSAVVGEEYEKDITTISESTFRAKKVVIKPGETYVAIHKGGTGNSTRRYVKVDKDDKVLEIGDYGNSIATDTFTATDEEIKVYINFYASDSDFTGQSLTKYTTEYVGGALNAAKDELNSNMNVLRPLYGKKIVCLGDSLTEFVGNDGKTYSDHLAEMSGAIIINGGFGGSQIRQHAEITGAAGMDVVNVVKALCSGVFPSTPDVGIMQYQGSSEERTIENVSSVNVSDKNTFETTHYADYTKLSVTYSVNGEPITATIMVSNYSYEGTTLTYTSDYEIVSTTTEWRNVIRAAEKTALDANDDNRPVVKRLEMVDLSKFDAITVFAGTNDWNVNGDDEGSESTIGTSGVEDAETTLGAINIIIRLLSTTYPNLRLYWFTPIVRYVGNDRTSANWSDTRLRRGMTLKQFSALIENEVELFHIPVCDLYNTLGWNTYNFSSFFNDNDSTHPRKGMKWLAEKIYKFLQSH